jgi:hypothetical protein
MEEGVKITVPAESSEFKPFDITLKVETEQELIILWHLFNQSNDKIRKLMEEKGYTTPVVSRDMEWIYDLWEKLQGQARSQKVLVRTR